MNETATPFPMNVYIRNQEELNDFVLKIAAAFGAPLAAVPQPVAPAGQAAAWPTEEQIDAYLEDYEMRGEVP